MFLDGPFQRAHLNACYQSHWIIYTNTHWTNQEPAKMKYVFIAFCLKSTMNEQSTTNSTRTEKKNNRKNTHTTHTNVCFVWLISLEIRWSGERIDKVDSTVQMLSRVHLNNHYILFEGKKNFMALISIFVAWNDSYRIEIGIRFRYAFIALFHYFWIDNIILFAGV